MNAIISTGGKQYRVAEGDEIFIEKLEGDNGTKVSFEVLAILDEKNSKFGTPLVEGASVEGEIVKQGKNKKIIIFKYKPKKGYRRKNGHRQPHTRVLVKSIKA